MSDSTNNLSKLSDMVLPGKIFDTASFPSASIVNEIPNRADAMFRAVMQRTPSGTGGRATASAPVSAVAFPARSEEHTSELQSRTYLVCRLLLEKKSVAALERGLPNLLRHVEKQRDRKSVV